jgi:hypothetical protein
MKKLLIIIFVLGSLSTFSQENKGICSASVRFYHESGNDTVQDDHFYVNGFSFTNPLYYGSFLDVTNSSDSTIYEITLPFGDSLLYSASWMADGMCYGIDTAVVNHILTVLEGTPFPITVGGYYAPGYYNVYQNGIIRSSCFLKIQKEYTYYLHIKYLDPPPPVEPEKPLTLWEALNELYLWSKDENTISVKADDATIWEMNLYALSGQLLQKHQFQGSQDVDVSKLPKGCYIAGISPENGKNKQLRFIR